MSASSIFRTNDSRIGRTGEVDSRRFARRSEMRNCVWGAAAAIVCIWLMSVPSSAQAPTAAPAKRAATRTWTPARTPDGQPDIQGIWEGGASFRDKGAPEVEVNVGPRDCNTYGKSAVNTPCAAYPALWTDGQRSGKIGSQSAGVSRGF